MDNRLNEIRRKIRFLRAEMLGAEDTIRKQINRDEGCAEASIQLMAMRVVMLGLIGERNRLGGEERLLDVEERLKADTRAVSRGPLKGARGRRER
jgi:tetrahydromethanopterin S-methyltransferase subunit G